jgi:O-antigen/teichoic acid export membrane protein
MLNATRITLQPEEHRVARPKKGSVATDPPDHTAADKIATKNAKSGRSSLRANTITNYISRAWAALVALLFLPLYANVLGSEAYGLIGTFTILQAWALLFDFGLTPTLNREMARFRAGVRSAESINDLLLTLEIIGATTCFTVAVIIIASASYLATHLLTPQKMSLDTLIHALQVMGFVVAMRWLEQIYRAALQGLQDQVWLGKSFMITETMRWAGAYVAIYLIRADAITFFIWQAISSIATLFVLRFRVTRHLSTGSYRPVFRLSEIYEIRQFAGGMFLSALLTFTLTQIDKVLVSQTVSLSEFGFYMLASAASGGLLQLIIPMNQSTLPKMVEYVSQNDSLGLSELFISTSKWITVIITPVSMLMVFFPDSIILLWTGNSDTVEYVSPILPWLALGAMVNGIMNTPYILQLAHGWTSIANKANIFSVVLMIPAAYILIPRFGMISAATLFLALNVAYLAFLPALTFNRLLPGITMRWFQLAVVRPLGAICLCGLALRLMIDPPTTRIAAFGLLLTGGAFFLAAAFWATRGPTGPYSIARAALKDAVEKRRSGKISR